MLISLLIQRPEALLTILARTPIWVWGLLAGLIALGASQLRGRRAQLTRVAAMPVSMLMLSFLGLGSAFKATAHMPSAMGVWLLTVVVSTGLAMAWRAAPPKGTQYNAQNRQFTLPGSHIPLVLILAIFLIKYTVGIELAMQPELAQSTSFALSLAAVYGLINGLFAARALRLWRLMHQTRQAQRCAPAVAA